MHVPALVCNTHAGGVSPSQRTNGHSLAYIIADVNRTLQGWFGYFKHSCRTTFVTVDGWVRMRLRSILRQRAGRSGRGRGKRLRPRSQDTAISI